jgi:hypothetical protein
MGQGHHAQLSAGTPPAQHDAACRTAVEGRQARACLSLPQLPSASLCPRLTGRPCCACAARTGRSRGPRWAAADRCRAPRSHCAGSRARMTAAVTEGARRAVLGSPRARRGTAAHAAAPVCAEASQLGGNSLAYQKRCPEPHLHSLHDLLQRRDLLGLEDVGGCVDAGDESAVAVRESEQVLLGRSPVPCRTVRQRSAAQACARRTVEEAREGVEVVHDLCGRGRSASWSGANTALGCAADEETGGACPAVPPPSPASAPWLGRAR